LTPLGSARRLPAFLAGKVQPASTAERSQYAQLCYFQRYYVTAARLWVDTFTADPKLADNFQDANRYYAACAAALAAAGQGKDAGQLTGKDRARWRSQALRWLQADLALRTSQLKSGKPADRLEVRQKLRHWQGEKALMGLRDSAAVARLSADEQAACKQLWAGVEALLTKAEPP
jgi:hypothetical protein